LKNKNKTCPYKKLSVFYNSCLKTFGSHLVWTPSSSITDWIPSRKFHIIHFCANTLTKNPNQLVPQHSFLFVVSLQHVSVWFVGHLRGVICSHVSTSNYVTWLQLFLCVQLLKLLRSSWLSEDGKSIRPEHVGNLTANKREYCAIIW